MNAAPFRGQPHHALHRRRLEAEALLRAIEGAQHHIHLQYYILADDATGRRLRDALVLKRPRRGRGAHTLRRRGCGGVKRAFFDSMRAEGIEAQAFSTCASRCSRAASITATTTRSPSSTAAWGFFGGMNIADRYVHGTPVGHVARHPLRLEGSAVHGLQASFLSDWSATTRRRLDSDAYYPEAPRFGDNRMQILRSGPFGQWRVLLQSRELRLRQRQAAHLDRDALLPAERELQTALQNRGPGGIDVRIMLPERSDSRIVGLASHSFLDAASGPACG